MLNLSNDMQNIIPDKRDCTETKTNGTVIGIW